MALGRFPFDRTDRPDRTFGRTNSTGPSNLHFSRIIYTSSEECEGLSPKSLSKLLHFLCKLTGLAGQFWQMESAIRLCWLSPISPKLSLVNGKRFAKIRGAGRKLVAVKRNVQLPQMMGTCEKRINLIGIFEKDQTVLQVCFTSKMY